MEKPEIVGIELSDVPKHVRKGKWTKTYQEIKEKLASGNTAVKLVYANEEDAKRARVSLAGYGNMDNIKFKRKNNEVFAFPKDD